LIGGDDGIKLGGEGWQLGHLCRRRTQVDLGEIGGLE
jgi:hypothetical protein